MWFAAFRVRRPEVHLVNPRLLEGSPDVLRLLASDPFAGKAPHFVRAELYDYRFTDRTERARTGAWWTRTHLGAYLPVVSLEDFRENP